MDDGVLSFGGAASEQSELADGDSVESSGDGGRSSAGGNSTGGAILETGGAQAEAGSGGEQIGGTDGAGGTGGSPATGGTIGTGGALEGEQEVFVKILDDADDATWASDGTMSTDERLHWSAEYGDTSLNRRIEVGIDEEQGRAALRFELTIPSGSTITSAVLSLRRQNGDAGPEHTMFVHVYETSNMPPFDNTHNHTPEQHIAEGVWSTAVGGFSVGDNNSDITSPDLSILVQRVVDRPDWDGSGALGLLLTPEDFIITGPGSSFGWANFADSTQGLGAGLTVKFLPPGS